MRSIPRAAVPLALAAGLVAAAPAAADAKPVTAGPRVGRPDGRADLPLGRAGPHRPRRARARARHEADRERRRGQGRAVAQGRPAPDGGGLARRQVRHPHRPAAGPARGPARSRARASQDDAVGPTYAAPAETGFAVLSLQHDVAAAVVQLIDGSHGTGLKALSTTLYLTLDRRDRAIQDIKALAPPPPPRTGAEDLARASQDEEAPVGFETVMPNTIGQFDDETQAIEATKSDATDLTAGGRRLLNAAGIQIAATKNTVNTIWPPVVPED